jgi:menaquinone-specific isochorismate synthase
MTQNENNEMGSFLESGAFLRLPSGRLRFWKGPFSELKSDKSEIYSVGYCDFFDTKVGFQRAAEGPREMTISEFRQSLQPFLEKRPGRPSRGSWREPSFELYQQAFQVILGKIHQGEIEKAVPIVFAESPEKPSREDLAAMIDAAMEVHGGLYVYGFWQNGAGILGATPEILFHRTENQVKTMALAGTLSKKSGKSPREFLKDPKELHEHQLVVKDIQQRLQKLGWVRTSETEAVEFPTLYHLRTLMELDVHHADVRELVQLLHPTPALGVSPRNYGLGWLRDLPYQKDRGLFGAPILFSLSDSETLCLVAIRSLQWSQEGARIGSGGGLVSASDLQSEWKELALKRESVMKALGL